jgi:hypothetical protein
MQRDYAVIVTEGIVIDRNNDDNFGVLTISREYCIIVGKKRSSTCLQINPNKKAVRSIE